MRTPKRSIWLGIAAALLYVSWPVIMWFYWEDVGASGILTPDSDTVIILMIEGVALAIIALPFVALLLWLTLRNYVGGVTIWLPPKSRMEWLWTIIYVAIAGLTLDAAVSLCGLFFSSCIVIHTIFAMLLLLYLRAAAVGQADRSSRSHHVVPDPRPASSTDR